MGPLRILRRTRAALFLAFFALTALIIWRNPGPRPYSPHYGLVPTVDASSRFAIVTFLGRDLTHKEEDRYFVACRMLTYQLLYANETRIGDAVRDKIDWVVAVTSGVDAWKREQLRRDGARVVELEDVPLKWWIKTGVSRWADQFTKLRLLLWTEYARVLFMDADTLLQAPIEDVFFTEASTIPAKTDFNYRKGDEADLPAEYVFLAAQDHQFTGKRYHAVPPEPNGNSTGSLSAGFWLAAPSRELYAYLMSVMSHYHRFNPTTMEQSLLNYAFRRCDVSREEREASAECPAGRRRGPMPWGEVGWQWSSTWPSLDDAEAGVVSLHEKFWKAGQRGLKRRWRRWRERMEDELGLPDQ